MPRLCLFIYQENQGKSMGTLLGGTAKVLTEGWGDLENTKTKGRKTERRRHALSMHAMQQ